MLLYVMAQGRGATDRCLSALAEDLLGRGVRAAGVVQHNVACGRGGPCDMDARVLPQGPVFRISQSLGPEARGCRLDPSALEAAVAAVEAVWEATRPEVLIVNKFGKHEAGGRGFRGTVARALGDGLPVVAGVNRLNLEAFLDFAGEVARPGPTDPPALADAVLKLLRRTAA